MLFLAYIRPGRLRGRHCMLFLAYIRPGRLRGSAMYAVFGIHPSFPAEQKRLLILISKIRTIAALRQADGRLLVFLFRNAGGYSSTALKVSPPAIVPELKPL